MPLYNFMHKRVKRVIVIDIIANLRICKHLMSQHGFVSFYARKVSGL